jgi:DNA uptake protein ComE-like DNA-binding protein
MRNVDGNGNKDCPAAQRRGMILFIVTLVVAMLAVASLALLSLLTTEYEATLLRGDEIQAGQLVQSGIELTAQIIGSPESEQTPLGTDIGDTLYFSQQKADETSVVHRLYDNPDQFRGVEVVPAHFDRQSRGAGRFTVFSPRIEQDRLKGIRFGLVNESTRLHLGTVLEWEIESPGQGARSLLKLPGMTPSMADSILDWLDADKTPRPSGAELDYYERAGLPYRPRNAVPVTLEELLLVRDVTRPLLFGTDESFSYGAKMSDLQRFQASVDSQNDLLFQPLEETAETVPSENPASEQQNFFSDFVTETAVENGTALPWCFLLTTLSAEKLVDPDGNAKIFLNDANLEFLDEQLRERLDEDSVKFILAWRKNNGSIADPVDLLDVTVTDKETSEELKSPFSLENSAAEDKFLTLLDRATTSSEVIVSGRINVNESPRVVLEAVPELNSQIVSQILNRRGVPGEKRQGKYRHTIWLLSEKIVDKETMKKLSVRLTAGGDVYRAQIVGFFDGQGTASRAEVVVDATVKPPRQIFSKDLTMFGSGFE